MKPRISFHSYPLSPYIVAGNVLDEVYTGREVSNPTRVAEIEAARLRVVEDYGWRRRFSQDCSLRCELAYNAGEPWIVKIMRSKTNHGRDTLYNFIRHWLAAELLSEAHRENPMA